MRNGSWSSATDGGPGCRAASAYPHHLRVAPLERVPDLPSLDDAARTGLAAVLVDVLGRFQRTFDPPMPYLFWWVQRPTDGGAWPAAWTHLELVSPWRSAGVARYVAAGELGGGVLINPVDPDDAAARLRDRMNTVVATAPGRINLIGEYTDTIGGWCLPMAIDLRHDGVGHAGWRLGGAALRARTRAGDRPARRRRPCRRRRRRGRGTWPVSSPSSARTRGSPA